MTDKITIAQITDIHIGPEDKLYQNIDVRENFLATLAEVKKLKIDLLVISGDVAAECGEIEAYRWVKSAMQGFPFPWVLMGGNHDHVGRMNEVFGLSADMIDDKLYFERIIKNRHMLFLDSSTDYIDKTQLEWLKKRAAQIKEEILLFIHHPPGMCGCVFMDTRYPLQNIEETRKYLKEISNIKNIFVGHYHSERFVIQDGKNIHVTPSTMQQINAHNPKFEVEHTRPGYRIIIWGKESLDTEVHYILR
jgi:Icc protein